MRRSCGWGWRKSCWAPSVRRAAAMAAVLDAHGLRRTYTTTQLHLALVMAIDAKLLVLDEPTLGLDILYRKSFYDSLLNDYFDDQRTIIVSTHEVEEIQHILTDVVFLARGRIVLNATRED